MSHPAPHALRPPAALPGASGQVVGGQARRAIPLSPGASLRQAGDPSARHGGLGASKPLPYPLFSESPGECARANPPTQIGIARLAALSPVEQEKNEVTYYR